MTREESKAILSEIESQCCDASSIFNTLDWEQRIEALNMAIQALEQTQWIPVSERLPEEGKDVLACFYTGEGNYKMMVSRRFDYNYWNGVGRTADMVAWQPLPKPYEPQESEDKE